MIDDLKRLYSVCFDDCKEYVDYFFKHKYSRNNTVIALSDNRIISMLFLITKKISLGNSVISCPYIVGACTHSDFRKQGIMRSLIYDTIEKLRTRGSSISALYPFSHDFYRQFGFVTVSRMSGQEINSASNQDMAYRKATAEDADLLLSLYKKEVSQDIRLVRNRLNFINKINEVNTTGQTAMFYYKGILTGYAMYDEEEIIESVGHGFEAAEELRGRNYYQQDDKGEEYLMMRINNPYKLLAQLQYPVAEASVKISLTDSFYPDNSSVFELNIKDGKAKILPASNYEISLSIEELTLLATGAWQRENYTPPEILKELFPPKDILIYDKY